MCTYACVCGDPIRLAALHTCSAASNRVLGSKGPIKDFSLKIKDKDASLLTKAYW